MIIDSLFQVAAVSACIVIILRTDPAINRMCRRTVVMIRHSIVLIQVGAIAELGGVILLGRVPDLSEVLVLIGVAVLLVCERRMRALVPLPRPHRRQTDIRRT